MVADQVVGQEATTGGAGSIRLLGATVEEMRVTRRRAEEAEAKLARAGQWRGVYKRQWQRAERRGEQQQQTIAELRRLVATLVVWLVCLGAGCGVLVVALVIAWRLVLTGA